ncbi:cystatin [Acrasis kona]|uniref:Cystatin n=1 Tax=Acrasis kona TaxID=1008807 RepID=A0AAW2Z3N4_9EUKA
MIAGGLTPVSPNSAEVREVALFAVDMLNMKSNAIYPHTLVHVKDSSTQVVQGVNYYLTLIIGGSPNGNKENKVVVWKKLNGEMELMSHR